MLSKHITFDEASLLKSTVSQQVERMKTQNISQRVKVNATPPSPVGSVSVGISPDMTPGRDHVTDLDVEQVEGNVDLVVVKGTKKNPHK